MATHISMVIWNDETNPHEFSHGQKVEIRTLTMEEREELCLNVKKFLEERYGLPEKE